MTMIEKGKRRRSRTRHCHTHYSVFRCPYWLLSVCSPRPSFARYAELERMRPRRGRKGETLLRLPRNSLQRKQHTVGFNPAPFSHTRTYTCVIFQDGTSSCPANTVLTGLNYLKGQPPVIALPDEDYPPWLWKLLEPRVLDDDGPGGKAEKVRLRKENRQRIRDQNLLKTQ